MNIDTCQIGDNLADAINCVAHRGERVVLEHRGKRVAAIVSIEDLELLEDFEDVRAAKRTLAALKRKGEKLVPLTDIIARMGQPRRPRRK